MPTYLCSFGFSNNVPNFFSLFSLRSLDPTEMEVFNYPNRIYKCDETSIILNPTHGYVLAGRKQKVVYDAIGSQKENITVFMMANAVEDIAPPLALFQSERIPTSISTHAPSHWGIGQCTSGWMNAQCFFEYFTNVLYPHLIENATTFPIIVFLDGHRSHLSLYL